MIFINLALSITKKTKQHLGQFRSHPLPFSQRRTLARPAKNIVRKIIRLADSPGTLAAFTGWP
jgi:hypothetical protein